MRRIIQYTKKERKRKEISYKGSNSRYSSYRGYLENDFVFAHAPNLFTVSFYSHEHVDT